MRHHASQALAFAALNKSQNTSHTLFRKASSEATFNYRKAHIQKNITSLSS